MAGVSADTDGGAGRGRAVAARASGYPPWPNVVSPARSPTVAATMRMRVAVVVVPPLPR